MNEQESGLRCPGYQFSYADNEKPAEQPYDDE
jgi:hypothetical protein